MEEIITVDGRQFKLSTDTPLTAEQKAQTIAEIRKQTGCGTCGPKVAKMGNDWQYGGVRGLPAQTGNVPTCPLPGISGAQDNPKVVPNTVTMAAKPVQGVSPYKITFRKTPAASADGSETGAAEVIATARLALTNATTNPTAKTITEGTTVTAVYTLDIDDLNGAVTKAGGDTMPSITFAATIEDSCTPVSTCVNACKIFVGCVAPVCDFTVS